MKELPNELLGLKHAHSLKNEMRHSNGDLPSI